MTETAHTPLPWEAQVLETENDPGVYIVGSNLGGLVCAALPWPTEIDAGEYSRVEANAAFIVHAVNSHHRLVEALEAFAFVGEDDPKDTQAVWEMIYRDRVQDWFSYEDFERARDLLAALKEAGR